jgi:hypothetical protein
MYCKSCGAALPKDARFCSDCGASIDSVNVDINDANQTNGSTRKMSFWKKFLLGTLAIAALAIGLAFFATSGLVDPVDRHFVALRKGDINAAYEETSQAFRSSTSLEKYVQFVNANPILTQVAEHSFSERKVENGIGYLSGKLITSSGGVQPIIVRLVKENDKWKILGISFESDPAK